MKRITQIRALSIVGLAMLANRPCQAQLSFMTNNGTIDITYYTGPGGAVVIPETITGLPVTTIEGGAFGGLVHPIASPVSVTIPSSVTNIGVGAFASSFVASITVDPLNPFYSSLDGVLFDKSQNTLLQFPGTSGPTFTIPDGVANVGVKAFWDCTNLTSIVVPNSVTNIAILAFYGCTRLTHMDFNGNAPSLGGPGDAVFGNDNFLTVYYLGGTTGWGTTFGGRPTVLWDPQVPYTYATNNGTITIKGYVGYGGDATIPSAVGGLPVTGIAAYAFYYLSGLTAVTIPGSVTNIGSTAFTGCTRITAITVDPLNPSYSSLDGVLFDKGQTTLLQFPGAKAGSYVVPDSVISIGDRAFEAFTSLTGVTMGNRVTSIGYASFRSCSNLVSVIMGNGVTNIGIGAFSPCTGLTNVAIPDSVISIGANAFASCYNLKSVTIGNSVASIGSSAFTTCGLTSVTIPGSVNEIGCYAFEYCVFLTNVVISNGVSTIDDYAFDHCRGLTSVPIPTSVTGIGRYAFSYCLGLTSVTIPNSVTNIGVYAFSGCTRLTNAIIGSGVVSIGDYAFYNCYALTALYFAGNAPTLGPWSLAGGGNLTIYYLPGTTGWPIPFLRVPQVFWTPQVQARDTSFGVRTNQFGFNMSWASGMTVVVEACTDLANAIWSPVVTNTLSGGPVYFSDPQWTNYTARFYRIRSQ